MDGDLDVEFSDLPLERDPTPGERLILRAAALLSGLREQAYGQPARITRLLAQTRDWLLAQPASERFADGSTSDDIELEVGDLPASPPIRSAYFERTVQVFSLFGTRFSFRTRIWRIAVVLCTIILVFALIFSVIPQARGWFSSLLARPNVGPAPASSSNTTTTERSAQIIIIEPDSTNVPGTQVVGWQVDATPGPAPQGQDCQARPLMRRSPLLGNTPVWVSGFDGERPTLHFAPDPVFAPVFPNGYGWTASLTVDVLTSYTQPVTLSGENLQDGTYIFFNYYPKQDRQSSLIVLNAPDTLTPPTLSSNALGHTLTWTIDLYFSGAGCYVLQAGWASGSWTVYFSAGR